ncbi:endonuclease Q family protein [Candidatus Woesearchaeota archaeon]|nr:endonuclease Q family protein [Candidatus Woesearchaeota archaeon]
MNTIADLHIHSRHSRGCSKDLNLANLEKYARIKGVNLLGTGDFTHPEWISEIKSNLTDDGTGILRSKGGYPFVMQTEVSLIYSQGGKGRRVHNVVLAPSIDVAEQITDELKKRGRVDYDGRPIFNISCIDFTDMMMRISKDIEVIPAHIWTPWFSMFGSKSGFDSMKEAFGDQLSNIHAIETGLSSDPPMNWRLSQLDRVQILSFSDLHSYWPWRIGREATLFDFGEKELSYAKVIKAIRTGEGLAGTIEVDPAYGKYHEDGHRACNVCMTPKESIAAKKICPACRRPMTIGVHHRVEELADRPEGYTPAGAKKFYRLVPLHELLANVFGKGMATKGIWEEYHKILKLGTEMHILLNSPREELMKVTTEKMARAIMNNREGKINIRPGYDGVYGVPLFDESEREYAGPQKFFGEGPEDKEKSKPAGDTAEKKPRGRLKKADTAQKGLTDF